MKAMFAEGASSSDGDIRRRTLDVQKATRSYGYGPLNVQSGRCKGTLVVFGRHVFRAPLGGEAAH